jgi:hypothetical protein
MRIFFVLLLFVLLFVCGMVGVGMLFFSDDMLFVDVWCERSNTRADG